jgi:dUTP pyrophosphatase
MDDLAIRRLDESATLPTRAHTDDAGLDLYASVDVPYRPGEVVFVPTGIAVGIQRGFVGIISGRSSLNKRGLLCAGGVIDAGYTGEVGVVLMNLTGNHGCIQRGSRVAQMLIYAIATPKVHEVTSLENSARGDAGFGSTGV